jgi:PPK2 family polyphosphate:nucleotide phosphotransferase
MKTYMVRAGRKVDLDRFDPDDTALVKGGKVEAREKSSAIQVRLAERQTRLFARHDRKLLVIFQGMDCAGKDGAIRHIMGGFDPQGTQVVSFKQPTHVELDHDFLWRVHQHVPAKGEVAVFNRSHYEDVLIVRVHELVPAAVWKARYEHINAFERLLSDTGTVILKFFLHISKEEQRIRLQARVNDPTKCWKFNPEDLNERKRWADYQRAYEDALSKTSTEWAPWYVVPANNKWYRNYVVSSILVDVLEKQRLKYPKCRVSGVRVK